MACKYGSDRLRLFDMCEFVLKDEIQMVLLSNDPIVVKRYLRERIGSLQRLINSCAVQLDRQAAANQWTFSSIEMLDTRLKEFVRLHHMDLAKSINYRIHQFNDRVREQQIFQQLSTCQLSAEQVGLVIEHHLNFVIVFFIFFSIKRFINCLRFGNRS